MYEFLKTYLQFNMDLLLTLPVTFDYEWKKLTILPFIVKAVTYCFRNIEYYGNGLFYTRMNYNL